MGHKDVVAFLIAQSVELNKPAYLNTDEVEEEEIYSVLDLALELQNQEISAMLVEAGAKPYRYREPEENTGVQPAGVRATVQAAPTGIVIKRSVKKPASPSAGSGFFAYQSKPVAASAEVLKESLHFQ